MITMMMILTMIVIRGVTVAHQVKEAVWPVTSSTVTSSLGIFRVIMRPQDCMIMRPGEKSE